MVEISVIVPALNEEGYIDKALDGLSRQSFRDFETIVVDGGSTDRTLEIARRKGARTLVQSPARGAGRARNAGAAVAKGELLLFLDADTVPSRGLLGVYSRIMKDEGVAAATGPIRPLEKTGTRYALAYKIVSVYFVRASVRLGRPAFMGSNFAVRKSAFMDVRGFNESMRSYEDWEFSNRLKAEGRMAYSMDATVRTSIRRVRKWGMTRYILFYITNFLRFRIFGESHKEYGPVR